MMSKVSITVILASLIGMISGASIVMHENNGTLTVNGTVIQIPTSVPEMTGSWFDTLLAQNSSAPINAPSVIPSVPDALGNERGQAIGNAGSFDLAEYLRLHNASLVIAPTFAPVITTTTASTTTTTTNTTSADLNVTSA